MIKESKHQRLKNLLNKYGNECQYWDDDHPECLLFWSNRCNGNHFACKKFYYKYLASSKKIDQKIVDFFENK